MPTPTPPETPALQGLVASSIGIFLIGSLFSVCLFGVNSLQAWLYYQHYPTDTAGMKATVAWVWILDTVHAIFLGHGVYFYVIRGFGDVGTLDTPVVSRDSRGINQPRSRAVYRLSLAHQEHLGECIFRALVPDPEYSW